MNGIFRALAGIQLAWVCSASQAIDVLAATVEVECTGRPGAQVAIRWGHPDHAVNPYMPLFAVPCGVGRRTVSLELRDRNSEFEVQTEGGIETSYAVEVKLADGSHIRLDHGGSPEVVTRGAGFALVRSSGPNRYGEQNFRVQLTGGRPATARIVAQVAGDRGDARMAMRWGHPDFHDNEYFPLWSLKPASPQERSFLLTDAKSEFEIQTEGGEGTTYHLSIWLDAGAGVGMQPSIEIAHRLTGTRVSSGTNAGDRFAPGRGNAYGETNVGVTVPALPDVPPEARWAMVSLLRRAGPAGGGPVPYAGQLGLGARGHYTSIRSAEPFDVELVGGGGATTDDCGKGNGRTTVLRAGQTLPDGDFTAAFGRNPTYPVSFAACAYRSVPGFNIAVFTVPDAQ